ncbi:hypothetical protein K469DRAFT_524155, partial [Zopfia rhizophila CBS 207.26]
KNDSTQTQIAIDILGIPPMSSEPERIFNLESILVTLQRNRLSGNIIEALEYLGLW